MGTITAENAVDAIALQQLVADYFHELDTTFGLNSPEFFTEEGVVAIGTMAFAGHAAMRAFYADLLEQVRAQPGGERTTRHAFTNLRIAFAGADEAIIEILAIEFSAPGSPPLPDASTPTIVSDARLRCRRHSGHVWRIFELTGRPVFAGNDPVLNRLLVG